MNRITKEKLLRLLFNPMVIAIPFALITIFLLPFEFSKYSFETYSFEPADKHSNNTIQFYRDLDHDSIDEIISHFETNINQCAIKIIQNQQIYKGQWNFNGFLPGGARYPAFVDVNMDGNLDVLVFYQRNDSIFMGGLDMLVDSKKLVNDVFIDEVKRVNDTTDYDASFRLFDLNGDGTDEVIMIVNAGYSEQPRRIYAWDYVTDTLIKSPVFGFRISNLQFEDIDDDGSIEIFINTTSYENIEEGLGIPYNDYERWFVVFDHELNFKYGPVNMGEGSGTVRTYVINEDGTPVLYIIDINNEKKNRFNSFKFDFQTQQPIPADALFNYGDEYFSELSVHGKSYYQVYDQDAGRFVLLDAENHMKTLRDKYILPGMSYLKSIKLDGYKAPLLVFEDFQGNQNMLRFYDIYTLDEVVGYSYPSKHDIRNISVYKNPAGKELVAMQLDEHIASLEFTADSFYLAKRGAAYILIYGFYVLLIWLILRLQDMILKKHYQREQLIAELKLKTIRNQLDPHFTFNAVNAIASAIFKEEKEVAYNYFSLFSKLLRTTTLYSDRMSRSLKDEIDFTMQYLDIEMFRYRDKFEYRFDVDDSTDVNMEVPRMIVQTFAESAVTNGLMHRKSGGLLNIHMRQENKKLVITFKDNGVGIQESKRLNKERAFKSVRIMDEFIRIFNELNGANINYEMHDINADEKYPGTRVIIELPVVYKYRGSSS